MFIFYICFFTTKATTKAFLNHFFSFLPKISIFWVLPMYGHFFLFYDIFSELRKATIPIFYDMMVCEARSRGNFKLVRMDSA